MARSFNGTSSDYLQLGTSSVLNPAAITVSAWVYLTSVPGSSTTSAILDRENGLAYHLSIYNSGGGGDILYGRATCSGGTCFALGSTNLSLNAWHHVAFTYDSVAGGIVYLDGVQDGTDVAVGTIATSTNNSSIGNSYWGGLTKGLTGSLADVAVWNLALKTGEISALSKGARPGRIRANARIAWWPLDGIQSPEPDLSGNKLNGTVNGTAKSSGPPFTMFTPSQTAPPPPPSGTVFTGSATFAGAGGLSETDKASLVAAATLAGSGGLTSTALQEQFASAVLAATGSLVEADSGAVQFASSTLAATGGLVEADIQLQFASATLGAAGKLTEADTGPVQFASSTLAAAGGLVETDLQAQFASSTLAAVGGLTEADTQAQFASAVLAGIGVLTANANTQIASAVLGGVGNLVAQASGINTFIGSAVLAGAGGLSADSYLVQFASAVLAGQGGLVEADSQVQFASATLAAAGGLSAAATQAQFASSILSGQGKLVEADSQVQFGSATFAGVGTLAADANIPGAIIASARLAAVGGLTAVATGGTGPPTGSGGEWIIRARRRGKR